MKKVITVCPYCASGCKINLVVDNGRIIRAEGANGVTNQGELCLKGYYGWDFIHDTKILTPRLKSPMIRRERGGKLKRFPGTRRSPSPAPGCWRSKRSTARMPL